MTTCAWRTQTLRHGNPLPGMRMWQLIVWLLAFGLAVTAIFGAPAARAQIAPGGALIVNIARATYVPAGLTQQETVSSNPVQASVDVVEALMLTADQTLVRPPSSTVTFSHLLTNTGNVTSGYVINVVGNGPGCTAGPIILSGLRVVRDSNNNGVVDNADRDVPLSVAGAVSLQAGEATPLLVQGVLPPTPTGTACVVLTARTVLQGLSASNVDTVSVGTGPAMQLTKSASYPGNILPGKTRIDFTVTATNIGASDALPSATLVTGAGASTITVNGRPMPLVLVRDPVPVGTQYVPGSLNSASAGAMRLFRYAGDAPFAYRTIEDASAIEVAIGLPGALVRNGASAMTFAVLVNPEQTGTILNTAFAYYSDGTTPAFNPSNTIVLTTSGARLGLAKRATPPQPGRGADGSPDGTVSTTFGVRIVNSGSAWLYDVQARDVMEGPGSSQFGAYTAAAVPGAGQYSIVPGSRRLAAPPTNGVQAAVNPAYTGQQGAADLLAPGAVLPIGAEITVLFDVRINATGRSGTLLNSATGSAGLSAGGPTQVSDVSTNGVDPDPDGDGNPANNSVPTPVPLAAPTLALVKSASLPRRVADGVYDIDYSFRVTNTGASNAPFLRVVDNLNCTFNMDDPQSQIADWRLLGPVRAQSGILVPSAAFTGRAVCNRELNASSDPFRLPSEVALSLTDGSRTLGPGQSETLAITVRVTRKTVASPQPVVLVNKAWAAAFSSNTVNAALNTTVAAIATTVQSLLIDPSGTVYDSVTRSPIPGALVTYSRVSCSSGIAGPIVADEIYNGSSGVYTFNADGTMSMTTGADGAYQFYLRSPPVTGLCTYAIKVTPPVGSGYVAPSQIITVTPGTFSSCGPVAPNATSPQGADPTTHYDNVTAGINADGSLCEVVNNHVPLDPGNIRGLVLSKGASRSQVEIGDFIDYALVLNNRTGFPVTGLAFSDTLPAGFAYVPGSSRISGGSEGPGGQLGDPAGGRGPSLAWNLPAVKLANDEKVTLRYRVRVGVGSPTSGIAVNRASAASGVLSSNVATHAMRLTGGVFSDEAFVFGKVYMACVAPGVDGRRAGRPDYAIGQSGEDAPGVPGVRLFLEDGTSVVTDGEGKWSLYGLKPITHVIRIDQTSLPRGTEPVLLDNRNAFDAQSRFVDLKNGELHKADFPLSGCANPEAMTEVAERRKRNLQPQNDEADAALRARLDPNAILFQVGDRRALPAAGGTNLAVPAASQQVVAAPLITLPATTGGSASFISGVGSGAGNIGTLSQAQTQAPGQVQPQAQQQSQIQTQGPVAVPASTIASAPKPAQAEAASDSAPVSPATTDAKPVQAAKPGVAPAAAGPVPDLETLLPTLDNTLAFIGLSDGETLPAAVTNIRVKGQAGSTLQLSVNGEDQPLNRVGKKATLESINATAWEYIGVLLKPGANILRLQAKDTFGNARGDAVEIRVTAPGRLADVQLDLPQRAYADGQTPVAMTLRLVDSAGIAVNDRTQITLEVENARWVEDDLNASEPGSQHFVTGGEAVFHLLPPSDPTTLRIRVSGGNVTTDATLVLVPALRPMIGVGIVEGTLDLTNRGKLAVGQDAASRAFEQDLSRIGNVDDDVRGAGRAAFFFKGTVLGKYLLTAAADTEKSTRDRLFRDIRPDEFYPIYGDSSSRGFDAQSTQRVYVRIDRDRSFLLYGDFISASSPEVRLLSQTNRTLTGLKSVVQTNSLRATTFAANTSQRQQIEEFPARGISGPYFLSGGGANAQNSAGNFIENSEKIELLVRDRNQPSIVLKTTTLERFTDYTIEPLTRRILFRQPLASLDANLNPQSFRVTYEVDSGGEQYLVAGTDVQLKVGENLQIGAVATIDNTPDNERKLAGVTALARIGKNTVLTMESVVTDTTLKGTGGAGRIELQYQDDKLGIGVRAAHSTDNFDNPASTMIGGRTEASARIEYRASETLAVRAEGVLSEDAAGANSVKGIMASVQKQFSPAVTGEIGARYGSATSPTASLFDYGQASVFTASAGSNGAAITPVVPTGQEQDLATVRGRLTAKVPGLKRAQVYLEGEQDLADIDRRTLSIGGSYDVNSKTRVYGRYVLDASLNGDFTLSGNAGRNVGIVGIESTVLGNGRVYNEYRIADALDGRTGQNATGLRNTFEVAKGLRLTGGIEYIHATGAASQPDGAVALGQGDSISFTSGFEYLTPRLKTSGILEARLAQDADTWLGSGGLAYRISDDWSMLARTVYSSSTGKGANLGNERELARHQIGVAWRPVDSNVWNGLARYERRSEVIRGGSSEILVGTLSGSSFGSDALLPGTYISDILSAHLNYNPQPGLAVMGRFAAKISTVDDGLLHSRYSAQLGQLRVIYDLSDRWDIGVQGAVMHGSGGAWEKSFGVELGHLVTKNLWISGGYNITGLHDRDLSAGEYTSQGAFLRMRFKFGEDTLGFGAPRETVRSALDAPTLVTEPVASAPEADVPQVTGPSSPHARSTGSPVAEMQEPTSILAEAAQVGTQILADALFVSGTATLREDRPELLEALASRIKADPRVSVELRIMPEADRETAVARGEAILAYLGESGADPARIRMGQPDVTWAAVDTVEIVIGLKA